MLALFQLAAELGRVEPATVARDARALLQTQGGMPRSRLNNDGTPLQLCVGASAVGSKVRLIGDPASDVADPDLRMGLAVRAMENVCGERTDSIFQSLCRDTIALTLPRERGLLREAGGVWLGLALNEPGVALYTNSRWGNEHDTWARARNWASALLLNPELALETIDRLSSTAHLVSLGIEGRDGADARAKMYFRLREAVSLERLAHDALSSGVVREFIDHVPRDGQVRSGSLWFGLGFSVTDGHLVDVKVDVCAHCVPQTRATWTNIVRDHCERARLRSESLERAIAHGACEVALVGLGVSLDGAQRLNVYVKAG